jgi:hypothetical protein
MNDYIPTNVEAGCLIIILILSITIPVGWGILKLAAIIKYLFS